MGYVLVEVYLIHSFSMFLGHQTYSLSVVLASLLVATGAGAALGGRVLPEPKRRALVGAVSALGAATVVALLVGPTLNAAWDQSLPVRAIIAIAFVAPLGFALGQPFVGALAFLREHYPERVPWCIGINGFASVIASTAIVPLSMAAGYSGVLAFGMVLYALAACSALLLRAAT